MSPNTKAQDKSHMREDPNAPATCSCSELPNQRLVSQPANSPSKPVAAIRTPTDSIRSASRYRPAEATLFSLPVASKDGRDFRRREDHRDALGQLGSRCSLQALEFAAEDGAVEEQDGAEGLVLGGGADLSADRHVGQVGPDLGRTQPGRVLVAVEHEEPVHTGGVGFLRAEAVVALADHLAHSLNQLLRSGPCPSRERGKGPRWAARGWERCAEVPPSPDGRSSSVRSWLACPPLPTTAV